MSNYQNIPSDKIKKLIAERARWLDADKSNTTAGESSFCDEQNDSFSSAKLSAIQSDSPRNPYGATSSTLLTTEARRTVLSVIRGLNRENERQPKKDRLSQ